MSGRGEGGGGVIFGGVYRGWFPSRGVVAREGG
jgi:hypothetical protein